MGGNTSDFELLSGFGLRNSLLPIRQAALFKATHKMAYADCFAAALAKERKAELVTGNPEFKSLEKEIKVQWLQ